MGSASCAVRCPSPSPLVHWLVYCRLCHPERSRLLGSASSLLTCLLLSPPWTSTPLRGSCSPFLRTRWAPRKACWPSRRSFGDLRLGSCCRLLVVCAGRSGALLALLCQATTIYHSWRKWNSLNKFKDVTLNTLKNQSKINRICILHTKYCGLLAFWNSRTESVYHSQVYQTPLSRCPYWQQHLWKHFSVQQGLMEPVHFEKPALTRPASALKWWKK